MRKLFYIICMGLAIWGLFGGCEVTDMKEGDKKPVEYTVVLEKELPEEIHSLIEQKKEHDFQMTYQDGEDLYLIRGYGKQEKGGYSIQVEEVYMGASAIVVKTNLIGPPRGEEAVLEPSYPYIVLKIPYQDIPVQFR